MKNLAPASLLLLSLSLGGAALAQDQTATPAQAAPTVTRHAPNPNRQTRQLAKRLSLTPDQATQVEPILVDRDQKIQSLMANTSLDPKSMHHQRRAIMADADQRLSAVLTETQKAKYAQLEASRRGHAAPESPATQSAPPTA